MRRYRDLPEMGVDEEEDPLENRRRLVLRLADVVELPAPDRARVLSELAAAKEALDRGDRRGAKRSIDLAHATLYTSTRFDPEIDAVLTPAETRAFYRDYSAGINRGTADALRPWLAPLRRLVWLRTITWCIRWRVESRGTDGWSRRRLEARVRRHMEACLADFFAPATIARVRAEWSDRSSEAVVA